MIRQDEERQELEGHVEHRRDLHRRLFRPAYISASTQGKTPGVRCSVFGVRCSVKI
jgi:hypothetical protein